MRHGSTNTPLLQTRIWSKHLLILDSLISNWFNRELRNSAVRSRGCQAGHPVNRECAHGAYSAPGDHPYNRGILQQRQGEASFLQSSILLPRPCDDFSFVCMGTPSGLLPQAVLHGLNRKQRPPTLGPLFTPRSYSQFVTTLSETRYQIHLSVLLLSFILSPWEFTEIVPASDLQTGWISSRIWAGTCLKHNLSY